MSDIKDKVITIIAERLSQEKEAVTADKNVIADLGADSLDIAEIMMDLEDEFGIKLEDEGENLKTIGDIVSFIENKVAANG